MKIYVVGSVPDKSSEEEKKRFEDRCRLIGEHLAAQNAEFVLGLAGSAKATTADFHILEGVNAYLKGRGSGVKIRVWLIGPEDAIWSGGKVDLEKLFPKQAFDLKTVATRGSSNQNRLIFGLRHSDVTLLLGGGNGTLTTGVAALAMKQPTLALLHCGGAADQVWQILLPHYARGPFSQADLERLETWDDESPQVVAQALQRIRKHNPFDHRLELNQVLLSISSLLCIVAWITLFLWPQQPSATFAVRFFILAGLATMLGSATRSIVRCYFDLEVRFSVGRFIAEFVLGVVVAFVLFLSIQIGGIVVLVKACH
jgi:hypothetical protein